MPHLMFGQSTSPAPRASIPSGPMRAHTAPRPTMNYPTYMGGFVPGPQLARRAVRPRAANPYTTSVSMYPTTGGISGLSAGPQTRVLQTRVPSSPSPYGNSLSPYAVASATDQRIACPVTPALAPAVRSPFFKAEPITVTMPTQPSFYQPGVPSQPISAEYVRVDLPRIVAREAAPYVQGAAVLAPYEGGRVY